MMGASRVVVAALLATSMAGSLDDSIAAGSVSSIIRSGDLSYAAYCDDSVKGALATVSMTADDALASHVAGLVGSGSGHVVASKAYAKHLEAERKAAEEAERKAQEEAARIEAERQMRERQDAERQSRQSTVGGRVAAMCANVATGPASGGRVTMSGERSSDARALRMEHLFDLTFGAYGMPFFETDGVDAVCAVLAATCDESLMSSGDAAGGLGELVGHVRDSDGYERVSGDLAPGDVVFGDIWVAIYVGEDVASSSGDASCIWFYADTDGDVYPCLEPSVGQWTEAWRPVSDAGMGISV